MTVPVQRITSQSTNVVTGPNRGAAVASLTSGNPPNAVNVTNAWPGWPNLKQYTNGNPTAFVGTPDPQQIWTANTFDPGQGRGFATRSVDIPLTPGAQDEFIIMMTVFADNAHFARIDATTSTFGAIQISNIAQDLFDGSMDPNSSLTTDTVAPYNWQSVRHYSVLATTNPLAEQESIVFIFSFEVMNYVNSGGPNPAGISFIIDIYHNVLPGPTI